MLDGVKMSVGAVERRRDPLVKLGDQFGRVGGWATKEWLTHGGV